MALTLKEFNVTDFIRENEKSIFGVVSGKHAIDYDGLNKYKDKLLTPLR